MTSANNWTHRPLRRLRFGEAGDPNRSAWRETMKQKIFLIVSLSALSVWAPQASAETIDVRLRIRQKGSEEKTITRANLIRINRFILRQGKRETYCNMYNNNPAYQTKSYRFYLNPDSGQQNMNCDPGKSEFHILIIRKSDGGKNQYRTVSFLDKTYVYITAAWPTDDLSVSDIRQFVVDGLKEILVLIEQKTAGRPEAGGGRQPRLIRDVLRQEVACNAWHATRGAPRSGEPARVCGKPSWNG